MKKEFCPHCGQSIMKHRQALTKGLVGILLKVAKYNRDTFHLQKDVSLTKNEYTNFQKLKFWGFVQKTPGHSGSWMITDAGYHFLSNDTPAPYAVFTFNNKVVAQDPDMVYFEDIDLGPAYRKKEDYIRDMQPVSELSGQGKFPGW